MIASKGEKGKNWQVHELLSYCACGILAGIIGGLLGIGGGFVMGPLFLELGIPPEVKLSEPPRLLKNFENFLQVLSMTS